MINSEFLDGMPIHDATIAMMDNIEKNGWGKREIRYNMHDWIFSRQHYWGEPTPMVYCEKCGWSALKDSELPLELPELEDYRMGEDGSSPLMRAEEWKKTVCPDCGGVATRETDVMPNWAGSNWYFLRFIDPHNPNAIIDRNKFDKWMPVDLYYGGQEHVTLHLLYSRFVFKFLHDVGVVPAVEPYAQRRNHGIILGADGRKMSKTWGNVINPDTMVEKFGADTLRCYLMFIGPYDGTCAWDDRAIIGVRRFIEKYFEMISSELSRLLEVGGDVIGSKEVEIAIKRLYFGIEKDISQLKFNTSIAALMKFVNNYKDSKFTKEQVRDLIIILTPFASHAAEELWQMAGYDGFAAQQTWKDINPDEIVEDTIEIPVQVNGKLKGVVVINKAATEGEVKDVVMSDAAIKTSLEGKEIVKFIYVVGRIVTIVVK
jgi:leucyl-tRNA synthetase